MLNVSQILRVTPDITKKRAKEVKIIKVRKSGISEGKSHFFLNCKTATDKYDCLVILQTDKKLTKLSILKAKAWVHCTCAHFMFRCEHALTKKGSSSLLLTRGVEPGSGATGIKANPREIPWACKHLVKTFHNLHNIKIKPSKFPLDMAIKSIVEDIKKLIPKKTKKKGKTIKIKRKK